MLILCFPLIFYRSMCFLSFFILLRIFYLFQLLQSGGLIKMVMFDHFNATRKFWVWPKLTLMCRVSTHLQYFPSVRVVQYFATLPDIYGIDLLSMQLCYAHILSYCTCTGQDMKWFENTCMGHIPTISETGSLSMCKVCKSVRSTKLAI